MKYFFYNSILILLILYSLTVSQSFSDSSLVRELNDTRTRGQDILFGATNNSLSISLIGVPLILLSHGYINNHQYDRNSGYLILTSGLITSLTTQLLKTTISRDRPFVKMGALNVLGDSLSPDHSFPSGHASSTFCLATIIALRYSSIYMSIPFYLYAILTGYGRIYSGVHYPSDVIFGAILGTGFAFLTNYIYKNNFRENVPGKIPTPFYSIHIALN